MINTKIIIASDSVGETAELVAKACMSQFYNCELKTDILRYPYIETKQNVEDVIDIAKDCNSILIYTLVKPDIREYMEQLIETHKIRSIDIMGPIMQTMQHVFEQVPLNEPGIVHKLDEDYFKKIEAMEFAVKYDDGKDPKGLPKADIVLIGVSRTSKTPISQYLAHKRYKVMNVPIVPEVNPPEMLFKIDPKKCIALKISPEKLNAIRKERLKQLGLSDSARYADDRRIEEELEYFNRIVEKIGCPVLDVSEKAIEETANNIIQIIEHKDSFLN
ncbi:MULTISPECIES: pyruvate, water dikinase regulatory protein [unclassified Staphylococcus]|uniref:pyruvate, water dikinase regulatory protein n=1 Tax=unclassified Staphylococcus TaxID=91994 RepID=UPI0021D3776E|nr:MULTISPECIES: pyruvate, water dikinase regulatory protein [unclassified Staphylococcus]UXR68654.1 kinase/pyrophosphorylase [Staphylococcus sp. IVB6246]UXR70712.1 kinase/pyrophosphorylase [Staphylococcus sp. IVB6240]UXR72942.1 kinase/pyrophosphorylase [Staphylococcus sp. IVB6238]UXR75238.1 kinase/pyrophosphorylase [Staphylococcus sp. IVB6233]UXR79438.1 kinase/pyrophosphorylase [Staphylococcus sp. IVB6218]